MTKNEQIKYHEQEYDKAEKDVKKTNESYML